ncbi:hypothetical protein [Chromohalobacter moromii]|uniref:Uncharacterized protein n=1 Tax=Chromohalobacter moromii TaxID=2860329 RepID=A0A9X2WZV0_9GAMM|nr:hypothetical protein [Chromohalobacter moromii]MCT8504018.1 hypothetical protein [Chromohalobacter moromii]
MGEGDLESGFAALRAPPFGFGGVQGVGLGGEGGAQLLGIFVAAGDNTLALGAVLVAPVGDDAGIGVAIDDAVAVPVAVAAGEGEVVRSPIRSVR